MEFTVDLTSKETCAPYHKVVFAKTHKTGSSTLQNVFFRYGSENGLTFAMPEKSWMFPFKEPFNSSMVLDLPWAKLGYDIFTFHSIWNYAEIKKVLPTAVYITILRDPVDCFESNYVYMGLQNLYKMDINEFAKFKDSRHMVRPSKAIIGKNQMLWDLGLDWREMENITLVQSKIKDLDSQFHFVLFAEHFDESLVMLAKILCWDLENMRYLKQNMRKAEKVSVISSGARETLSKWLQADYMLYDHFLEKFKRERESYGLEKLATDVRRLELLNLQLKEDCVIEVADNSKLAGEFRMAVSMVEGYLINETKPWCAPYARSEPSFTVHVRKQQMARAGYDTLTLHNNKKLSVLNKGMEKHEKTETKNKIEDKNLL
ncbi:galactosylceramide sulfotransferase isoform X3 [Eurytemora carolleeae]|nr:galactosylceramide sulfotransferase isoform X3 [Eurytemora carolleeae]|eukprot:XP_023347053.1 galactosylceramide sulfotransferase-like isoform X3 [Eurytemora affinis]